MWLAVTFATGDHVQFQLGFKQPPSLVYVWLSLVEPFQLPMTRSRACCEELIVSQERISSKIWLSPSGEPLFPPLSVLFFPFLFLDVLIYSSCEPLTATGSFSAQIPVGRESARWTTKRYAEGKKHTKSRHLLFSAFPSSSPRYAPIIEQESLG